MTLLPPHFYDMLMMRISSEDFQDSRDVQKLSVHRFFAGGKVPLLNDALIVFLRIYQINTSFGNRKIILRTFRTYIIMY